MSEKNFELLKEANKILFQLCQLNMRLLDAANRYELNALEQLRFKANNLTSRISLEHDKEAIQ